MKIHAIIVAAGTGSRFGGPVPKQFLPLGGIPVVMRAIDALRQAIPGLSDTIVLSAEEVDRWHNLCLQYSFRSPTVAHGGATRFHSVRNALAVAPADADVIMVHDGARPFPAHETIVQLIEAMRSGDSGAIPAVAVTDSLRILLPNGASAAVDRSKYRAVQTPQAFPANLLHQAYAQADDSVAFTDDASVMEAAGHRITLVEGTPSNIKITNPHDIARAEASLPTHK